MEIESISHKALRRFFLYGETRGLDARLVERLGKILVLLIDAESTDELRVPPNFGAHALTGYLAGTWSLTVSRNWRMTFALNDAGAIIDLNLEDHH